MYVPEADAPGGRQVPSAWLVSLTSKGSVATGTNPPRKET